MPCSRAATPSRWARAASGGAWMGSSAGQARGRRPRACPKLTRSGCCRAARQACCPGGRSGLPAGHRSQPWHHPVPLPAPLPPPAGLPVGGGQRGAPGAQRAQRGRHPAHRRRGAAGGGGGAHCGRAHALRHRPGAAQARLLTALFRRRRAELSGVACEALPACRPGPANCYPAARGIHFITHRASLPCKLSCQSRGHGGQ